MYNNTLTEKALSVILVIYQMGQGVPTYLFQGHDIIDAIGAGFVEDLNDSLHLTDNGQTVMKELFEFKEIRSFKTETSEMVRKLIGVSH